MKPVQISGAETAADLRGILALQQANLPKAISRAELREQGFLTVEHNFEVLEKMNSPFPHVIAKSENKVVGFALTMLPEVCSLVPVLKPMFEQINQLDFNRKSLGDSKYLIMGQICIAKAFRSQGLFYQLYDYYKKQFAAEFEYVITEVSERNQRSMQAHLNAGFIILKQYSDDTDDWALLLLQLK